MEIFIGLLGLLGVIIFGVMTVIGIVKKSGNVKKQGVLTAVSSVLCITALLIGNSNQTNTASTEAAEEVEVKSESNEIIFEYETAEYIPDSEEFKIVVSTNIIDGTTVRFHLKPDTNDSFDFNGRPSEGVVKDGKVSVSLGKYIDEVDGSREYIQNGEYTLSGWITVEDSDDDKSNVQFLEEYGDYNTFIKNYKIDADFTEMEDGYFITDINPIVLEITNAYTEEEINGFYIERRAETEETIPYSELDNFGEEDLLTSVIYTGDILEIEKSEGRTVIILAVEGNPENVLLTELKGSSNFVEGDSVKISGMYAGHAPLTGFEGTVPVILTTAFE